MVDQRGIVGAWKWIVSVFSASLQSSVKQLSGCPAAGHHHQQSHGGFVFPKPKSRALYSALTGLTKEVKALHRCASLIVKNVRFRERFTQQHGLPYFFEKRVHCDVLLVAVLGGEWCPSMERRRSFSSMAAEEILPSVDLRTEGFKRLRCSKLDGFVLARKKVGSFLSTARQRFVDLA